MEDNLPDLHFLGSVLFLGCIQLCMLLKLMRFQDGVVQAVAEAQEGFPGVLEVPFKIELLTNTRNRKQII